MSIVKRVLLTLFLAQPLTGCAFTDGPFEGQVLDYDTGKPIPGAIAVALWKSSTLDSGQGVCVHAETAVSGADGKYHIPRWWQAPPVLILSAARMLDVYKEGYENVGPAVYYQGLEVDKWVVYRHKEVIGTFADKASAKEASHPNDVYLRAFSGTSSERFEYLRYRVFSGTSCTSAGASQRNLYRLLKTAYQEAKPLAVTKEQQRILSFMRANALDTWLALPNDAPPERNPEARVPESVRKDLE